MIIYKSIIIFISFLILVTPALALQQTSGPLYINITQGEHGYAKYGIKNEGNDTIVVKLSANGTIENYINYPKELTLKPDEFVYINVTTNIPSDYKGNLNGTLYTLKEGGSGQVQLNIRLGKHIDINVVGSKNNRITLQAGVIIFISLLILLVAMIKSKQPKKYKIKQKESEKNEK